MRAADKFIIYPSSDSFNLQVEMQLLTDVRQSFLQCPAIIQRKPWTRSKILSAPRRETREHSARSTLTMSAVLMAPIPSGFTEQTQKIGPRRSRQAFLYERFTGSDVGAKACRRRTVPTETTETELVPTRTKTAEEFLTLNQCGFYIHKKSNKLTKRVLNP